ncbi:flagellar hook-basal body protein [Tepidiforma sp.]|uniref:flagellar hook-basal body protein n=1 Tax=Tepidiforma sp. TaxID=2682230 RepID=UPI002ADE0AE9|nr:flagellar hook-basal body protein [Tepidiforma sp.]
MIKGLYTAFTAMEAAWRYQDVLANNIANANTIGFKREIASLAPQPDVPISQQAPVPAPLTARIQAVIGQIGTGKFVAEFATDFQQGMLRQTGNELDLALTNGFFAITDEAGTRFLTRDGRFSRDVEGSLVTSAGYYVLGEDGQPIILPPEPVTVTPDGAILDAAGNELAGLLIRDFAPGQLERAGEAYFRPVDDAPGVPPIGGPGLRQGFLESSNANLIEELTSLLAVQRTYQANQAVLARLDTTLDQAAGELGRL